MYKKSLPEPSLHTVHGRGKTKGTEMNRLSNNTTLGLSLYYLLSNGFVLSDRPS
jgi:hypothetical protein